MSEARLQQEIEKNSIKKIFGPDASRASVSIN